MTRREEKLFHALLGLVLGLLVIGPAVADQTEGWLPPPTETFGCEAVYVCDEAVTPEGGANCQWVTVC